MHQKNVVFGARQHAGAREAGAIRGHVLGASAWKSHGARHACPPSANRVETKGAGMGRVVSSGFGMVHLR